MRDRAAAVGADRPRAHAEPDRGAAAAAGAARCAPGVPRVAGDAVPDRVRHALPGELRRGGLAEEDRAASRAAARRRRVLVPGPCSSISVSRAASASRGCSSMSLIEAGTPSAGPERVPRVPACASTPSPAPAPPRSSTRTNALTWPSWAVDGVQRSACGLHRARTRHRGSRRRAEVGRHHRQVGHGRPAGT